MPKKPTIPKFRSGDEEVNWRGATELMARAVETGRDGRGQAAQDRAQTVTMRLPEPDIEAAKDLAFRKGLPYQTYIKMLLHGAIERERRSA